MKKETVMVEGESIKDSHKHEIALGRKGDFVIN